MNEAGVRVKPPVPGVAIGPHYRALVDVVLDHLLKCGALTVPDNHHERPASFLKGVEEGIRQTNVAQEYRPGILMNQANQKLEEHQSNVVLNFQNCLSTAQFPEKLN